MIKMGMRLDKSQVSSKKKVSSGAGIIFDRDLLIMAGFKNYELTLIGGAGGKAGDCNYNATNYAAGGGGGGGGVLHIKNTIASLPLPKMLIWAGSAGADGTDSDVGSYAGNGYDGLPSYLSDPESLVIVEQAYGGKGALGGRVRKNASGEVIENTASVPGNGGHNSRGYGTIGLAASAASYTKSGGNTGAVTLATSGTYADSAPGSQTGGGGGGGGGKGGAKIDNGTPGTQATPSAGAQGNYDDFGVYTMNGEAAGSKKGGSGGGSRCAADSEYYGGIGAGGLAVIVFT